MAAKKPNTRTVIANVSPSSSSDSDSEAQVSSNGELIFYPPDHGTDALRSNDPTAQSLAQYRVRFFVVLTCGPGYTNGAVKKQSRLSRTQKFMAQDVHEDWADVILIILSFISGMVDSAVFNTWSCFVSMQTGMFSNTVFAVCSRICARLQ